MRPGVGGTNRAGFHDRDHGAPTGRRLVVVGDSVAWGTGPPAEAFPALAEAALPGWEVMNLAHHGYDAAQVAAVLAGDGPACDARAGQPAGFCAEHLARARRMHDEAVALGLPAASALPWPRASGRDAFFPADGADPHHPGREGHEVLAQALVEVLRRHAEGLPLPGPDDPP